MPSHIDSPPGLAPGGVALRAIGASGGVRYSYLECGAGAAVVLLHGIGSRAWSWKHQLSALSDHFRVCAWDAPGYGESDPLPLDVPETSAYASRLALFLNALGIDRSHLVAHSFGCVIAARFALENPGRVLSLTLASIAPGHARLPAEERSRLLDARLRDLDTLGTQAMAEKRGPRLVSPTAADDVRRAVIKTMSTIHPAGYRQAAKLISNADTAGDVARLDGHLPMQVIFGASDIVTTPEMNLRVAEARRGTAVHVIPGAGHAVYLERPDEFNTLIREFLAGSEHRP